MAVSARILVVGALSVAAGASSPALAASSPKGVWIDEAGRGAVEIKDCGNALCGHVVWTKDAADSKGCGKQIIGNVRPAGGSIWGGGWVYSPEKKKRYDVELTPLAEGKLRVVGFAGIKLFSKTMVWTRAPDDLARCGTVEAAVKTAPAKPVDVIAAKPAEPALPVAKPSDVQPPKVETRKENLPAAKTEVAAPAPQPQAESKAEPTTALEPDAKEVVQAPAEPAENEAQSETESGSGDLNLGDLDLSKVLKRTKGGGCKLDLPWVKIEFGCE